MKRRFKAGRVAALVVGCITLLVVIYIMANGLGLQDSLDFGAGAYYYADIPEFDKYTADDAYRPSLPYWVYVALFLIWGFLMYRLWKWIDKD